MLFNSHVFIFLYLPIVIVGFFQLGRLNERYAATWLAFASLIFYGYWSRIYVVLLLVSILCNYIVGIAITKMGKKNPSINRKLILTIAITGNLFLLGYYKYANFFLSNYIYITGDNISFGNIVLPLGISFYTFTQIAFLVDTYQGKVKEYSFVYYLLFVTYFPHLIAGPLLHHREMMPQFSCRENYRIDPVNIMQGFTLLAIGFGKKLLLADNYAIFATSMFESAEHGVTPLFHDAWVGVLAYTLQIYFDFSGYTDMAIGISLMFNIRLPINFNSPYRSTNIIDFWRRWHITLSTFLRDYLYVPLGGNRYGKLRRYLSLMVTMLLGGLWHGAGWTFLVWGGLHGIYLVSNHGWRYLVSQMSHNCDFAAFWLIRMLSGIITFLAVTIAWVPFRASTTETAVRVANGLFSKPNIGELGLHSIFSLILFSIGAIIIFTMPTSQSINDTLVKMTKDLSNGLQKMKAFIAYSFFGCILCISVLMIGRKSEFLYYQF